MFNCLFFLLLFFLGVLFSLWSQRLLYIITEMSLFCPATAGMTSFFPALHITYETGFYQGQL